MGAQLNGPPERGPVSPVFSTSYLMTFFCPLINRACIADLLSFGQKGLLFRILPAIRTKTCGSLLQNKAC
jgi:hypothetical protein